MSSSAQRRTGRRIAAGVGMLAAGSVIAPHGVAVAEPAQEEVEQRVDELTEEADTLVQEYNEVEEDLEAAQTRLERLEEQVGEEEERYDELRGSITELATAAYQSDDLAALSTLLSADAPEDVVEHAADVTHLSESRRTKLDEFTGSAERLLELRAEAEEALEEAEERQEELEEKTEEVEEALAEQEDLLEAMMGEELTPDGETDSETSYGGSASGNARTALDYAYAQIGTPYQWGGTGNPGYDCSGLTMRAWNAAGVPMPRTTWGQAEAGQRVGRDALRPGDLVFFHSGLSHVGMYAGNDQMVHAPTTGRTVEVVPMAGYWDQHFQFGVRP